MSTPDWRDGFGTLPADKAEGLERLADESRERASEGLAKRQQAALEAIAETEEADETA